MGSLDDLIRDLRKFEGRKEVTKALRREIRKPIPAVRRSIRARALDTLPRRGGLNVWVSKSKVTAQIKLSGRTAGVRLRGSRKSANDKSDLRRIDAGRVRAPSWGRRGAGDWHTQQVTPGYFTKPSGEVDQWRKAAVDAIDQAAEVIRRG